MGWISYVGAAKDKEVQKEHGRRQETRRQDHGADRGKSPKNALWHRVESLLEGVHGGVRTLNVDVAMQMDWKMKWESIARNECAFSSWF